MHGYYCTGPVMEIYVGDTFSCDKNSKGQTSLRKAYIFYGIKSSYPERGSPETDSPLEKSSLPMSSEHLHSMWIVGSHGIH